MKLIGILILSSLIGIVSFSYSLYAQEEKTEDSFVGAVATELQNDMYQTTLPEPEEFENPFNNFSLPDWVGPLVKLIFWILIILLGLFIIYQLARYWDERKAIASNPKEKSLKPVRAFQKDGTKAYIPTLADVEKKAEAGRFQDAIHLLLLIAIHQMYAFLNAPVPEAKTSREILREGAILKKWGGDLGHLVKAVEDSLFAGKKTGQPQYLACRKTFDRLIGELGGQK